MSKLERTPEYNWNAPEQEKLQNANFGILDTTLRDGVQVSGEKVIHPSFEDKIKIVDASARLGVEAMDIHLPADPNSILFQEGVEVAKHLKKNYKDVEIFVLTPTRQEEVNATLKFAKEAGVKLSSILFRGSSDYRLIVEDWNEEQIIEDMYKFSKQLTGKGVSVVSATEDSTRTRPDLLKNIFLAGKYGGAQEFCIADTVGYSTPAAIAAQMEWLKKEVIGGGDHGIHFHGHRDTGNEIANSIEAIKASTDKSRVLVHSTWGGVGERAGNTSLVGLVANLVVRKIGDRYDPSQVFNDSKMAAQAFNLEQSPHEIVVGEEVAKTQSGIHAAAIDKAEKQDMEDFANLVYSPYDLRKFGRNVEIVIGPMSGNHNVEAYLRHNGLKYTPESADALLRKAAAEGRELKRGEVVEIIDSLNNGSFK